MWTELQRSPKTITEDQFWTAINVLKKHPHVVSRQIFSIAEMTKGTSIGDIHQQLKSSCCSQNTAEDKTSTISFKALQKFIDDDCGGDLNKSNIEFSIRKVLPRRSDQFNPSMELFLMDKDLKKVYFINFTKDSEKSVSPLLPYRIVFSSGNFVLEVFSGQGDSEPRFIWQRSQLLPHLEKWAVHASPVCGQPYKLSQSLSLIDIEKYTHLYHNLKEKYGLEMVQKWPECTDPSKFVYEDVAIATYLLLLWEKQKLYPCSFIDLGCGNGLLVHILNSEGHQGIGLDVRERKIWSIYPSTTKLKVETIVPTEQTLFHDADWLIGNHSDELTPWIPVMAARSSQKTRYFVLPCCPFEFDGRKYNRQKASQSQYNAYLEYIQRISEGCGFQTSVDRLRIPSTKRICLVGEARTYKESEWGVINEEIKEIIRRGCLNGNNEVTDGQWVANFKPREKEEKVRNCTKVDRALQDSIVERVVSELLATHRPIKSKRLPTATWNVGGILPLGDVAGLISPEQLKQLKHECGGLQTLLRNHHQIFRVIAGQVELRLPQAKGLQKDSEKKRRVCTKPCWFHTRHPDGCLLTDNDCCFMH